MQVAYNARRLSRLLTRRPVLVSSKSLETPNLHANQIESSVLRRRLHSGLVDNDDVVYGLSNRASALQALACSITLYAKQKNDSKLMVEIMKLLKTNGLPLQPGTADIVFSICYNTDNWDLISKYSRKFLKAGAKLRQASFDAWMTFAAKRGDIETIWKIEKLRSDNMKQHSLATGFSCAKGFLLERKPEDAAAIINVLNQTLSDAKRPGIMVELQKLVSEWPLEVLKHQKEDNRKVLASALQDDIPAMARGLLNSGLEVNVKMERLGENEGLGVTINIAILLCCIPTLILLLLLSVLCRNQDQRPFMDKEETSYRVLMFPWLAHGHISPFLELSKKLSEKNFLVYFCSTPINLSSVKERITGKFSPLIHLVELHLPSSPELPPHYHTTNGLPPDLMSNLVLAFETASSSLSNILETLKPSLLIYDIFQPWVPALAASRRIPAVHFLTTGATATSFFFRLYRNRGVSFPSPAIYLRDSEIKKMRPPVVKSSAVGPSHKDRIFEGLEGSRDITLIKSCREIEGKYIDYLSSLIKKKMVPVGPLVEDDTAVDRDEHAEIIQWLSRKEPSSSVFVSFGSEYFLSKEETEELAFGLELSKVNFIWVIRFPAGENTEIKDAIPEGFLDRVKERGMVVEGWAPQTKILGHPSTGGFVSHCGWSSVMESMNFGVPLVAIPMQLDQPLNARLVVEVGVAVEVIKDDNGEFKREEVAKRGGGGENWGTDEEKS
ncbi:LOW QUALITY PROTEIN: hypothetical protein RJ640_014895 [Escallonia rubra]|uniref:Glycosyltransferase N-terminal domain-containing protein n=1 Tax=Escallonia rubra TaxID=112253 RepID=A0AA88RU22_9ASTE|nr:LOW QUALITY PROTEIN: hypothetical protein RJ640_014895 [Escallonia rubra]